MIFKFRLIGPPTSPLHPINPDNARPPRITAAAGTKLAGAFFKGTVTPRHYLHLGFSSPWTDFYTPQSFINHAALLRQAFAHCAKFPTAASRRSLGRISVPVWLIILSDQLLIVALVSRYPTNKLIRRRPISQREPKPAFIPNPMVRDCIRYYSRFPGAIPV